MQLIRFDEAFRIRLLSHVENWICARQTLWHLVYGCVFFCTTICIIFIELLWGNVLQEML